MKRKLRQTEDVANRPGVTQLVVEVPEPFLSVTAAYSPLGSFLGFGLTSALLILSQMAWGTPGNDTFFLPSFPQLPGSNKSWRETERGQAPV